ncbi:MAG: hypothetical protein V7746_07865 [Halioglobus sp.]
MTTGTTFNPQELCSRKLWELINNNHANNEAKQLLEAAIAELEERRSYLAELQNIGDTGAHT